METINRLKKDATLSGVDLFEALVDAWETIVTENTDQLNLVTKEQASTWLGFKKEVKTRLETVGKGFTNDGVWDNTELQSLRMGLSLHVHKTEQQIINEQLTELTTEDAKTVKARKTVSLLARLRKLR